MNFFVGQSVVASNDNYLVQVADLGSGLSDIHSQLLLASSQTDSSDRRSYLKPHSLYDASFPSFFRFVSSLSRSACYMFFSYILGTFIFMEPSA